MLALGHVEQARFQMESSSNGQLACGLGGEQLRNWHPRDAALRFQFRRLRQTTQKACMGSGKSLRAAWVLPCTRNTPGTQEIARPLGMPRRGLPPISLLGIAFPGRKQDALSWPPPPPLWVLGVLLASACFACQAPCPQPQTAVLTATRTAPMTLRPAGSKGCRGNTRLAARKLELEQDLSL